MAKKGTSYYLKEAREIGCTVKSGSKHFKVYKPEGKELPERFRNPMTIPHELKGDGTERNIIAWLAAVAVVFWVFLVVIF